eukprot:11220758-Lingulodinium_polyedra.AAC.1
MFIRWPFDGGHVMAIRGPFEGQSRAIRWPIHDQSIAIIWLFHRNPDSMATQYGLSWSQTESTIKPNLV